MTTYHPFSSKAAASRLRALTKAKAREQQQREEATIWHELVAEQLILDRQRNGQAPRRGKRGKAAKPEPTFDDWLRDYERALAQFRVDYCKRLQHRPPRASIKKYTNWLLLVGDLWSTGARRESLENRLLSTLFVRAYRSFLNRHGTTVFADLRPAVVDELLASLVQLDSVIAASTKQVIATARKVIRGLDKRDRKQLVDWFTAVAQDERSFLEEIKTRRHFAMRVRAPEDWRELLEQKPEEGDKSNG